MSRETDLAYCAGFISARARIGVNVKESLYRSKKTREIISRSYVSVQLAINSGRLESLDRIKENLNAGIIMGPYKSTGSQNPYWMYQINIAKDIQEVLKKLKPYLDYDFYTQAKENLSNYYKLKEEAKSGNG